MMAKLTEAKVRALKPPQEGQAEYADTDVPGLRVRIGRSGKPTFILRRRVAGKMKNITLGRYCPNRFNLNDARRKARTLISDIEVKGTVPRNVRAKASRKMTMRDMVPDYIAYIRDEKRNRTWAETERIFNTRILPALGDRFADTITRGDITALIEEIDRPATARVAFAAISSFYTWAMPALDKLESNPARDARKPTAAPARDRVLTDAELRALWRASDAEPFPWRAVVKLLILTAARRNEVAAALRDEFDIDRRVWTIPAARAKNSVAHLVPLSDAAVTVFESIPRIGDSDMLFPASRGGTGHASGYSKLAARLRTAVEKEVGKPVPLWRLHDIRRTAATGMQRLGVRLEVTEAVLNHISGSRAGIVGVYQHYDFAEEKHAALDAWAAEVERIVRDT